MHHYHNFNMARGNFPKGGLTEGINELDEKRKGFNGEMKEVGL